MCLSVCALGLLAESERAQATKFFWSIALCWFGSLASVPPRGETRSRGLSLIVVAFSGVREHVLNLSKSDRLHCCEEMNFPGGGCFEAGLVCLQGVPQGETRLRGLSLIVVAFGVCKQCAQTCRRVIIARR